MGVRRITVTIDRLVLRGVHPGERLAVAEAFSRELAGRLETTASEPWTAPSRESLEAPMEKAPESRGSGWLGSAAARALERGIRK